MRHASIASVALLALGVLGLTLVAGRGTALVADGTTVTYNLTTDDGDSITILDKGNHCDVTLPDGNTTYGCTIQRYESHANIFVAGGSWQIKLVFVSATFEYSNTGVAKSGSYTHTP